MKPFLKWAGGKYRLVERIREALPKGNRLIEPFVGSGAVFMNTDHSSYLLSDVNADLIFLFQQLKEEGPTFIEYCKSFFTASNNSEEVFYEFREKFNSTKDPREKAALFVYLNRHCFNGLCRYNSKGKFNVPFGRYKSPPFAEAEMIAFHEKAKRATFLQSDFRTIMLNAQSGDVVYCDPPYVPLSKTSNFTDYAAGGFGYEQQTLLAELAEELRSRGVPVLISNHDTDFTRDAYKAAEIKAFDVQRFISSNSSNRGKAAELLAVFS